MHICPDEIIAFIMLLPFIGHIVHRLRHKLGRTVCLHDETCAPKCNHPVVRNNEVHDPLDP